jgi:hypothetical protein
MVDYQPFSNYLNSVAKLDAKMRNLIKLNKEMSEANRRLREENLGLMVRYEAQTRILEQLDKEKQLSTQEVRDH